MISDLYIKNIALIRELKIEFKKGLNVLSGETGAGKSIIIDSINFVLGDRADRSLIRHGETYASVEVVFNDIKNDKEVLSILREAGIDGDDDCIIISRVMTNDRSECRINRKIVNLSLLRTVVGKLVDTHTQNEHQALMKTSYQLKILDSYNSQIQPVLVKYTELLNNYNKICDKLSLFPDEEAREREMEMLRFQIEEIEKVDWQKNEEEALKNKISYFYNAQKIVSGLTRSSEFLSGDSGYSALSTIKNAENELHELIQFDSTLTSLCERLDSAYWEIKDIAETVRDTFDSNEESETDIDKLENRLEEIRLLKRKYGKTYESVQEFYKQSSERLIFLRNAEEEIETYNKQKVEILSSLRDTAIVLHELRVKTANGFCESISRNLDELGMKNAVFVIRFSFNESNIENELRANGTDSIEFMLSPNLGEPVKPLSKIASGGEMSRIMLAIKNVIAEIDDVDTLIFDEIDTGISGNIAKVVSQKLFDISRSGQVIAITHLPQLASMADTNFLIEKKVVEDKSLTFIHELSEQEVLSEILRLSGSSESSRFGLSNAKEMKEQASKYKKTKTK